MELCTLQKYECYIVREGLRNKIKKKYGIFHTFLTPPARGGKVWNLFMIFFNIQGTNLRCFLTHFTAFWIRGKVYNGIKNNWVAQKWNGM